MANLQPAGEIDTELTAVAKLRKALSNDERMQFDVQFATRRKNPTTALILSIVVGVWGIDRFYIGHAGLGLGKLFTFGAFGVWAFIDWFLIMEATRRVNIAKARQLYDHITVTRS